MSMSTDPPWNPVRVSPTLSFSTTAPPRHFPLRPASAPWDFPPAPTRMAHRKRQNTPAQPICAKTHVLNCFLNEIARTSSVPSGTPAIKHRLPNDCCKSIIALSSWPSAPVSKFLTSLPTLATILYIRNRRTCQYRFRITVTSEFRTMNHSVRTRPAFDYRARTQQQFPS